MYVLYKKVYCMCMYNVKIAGWVGKCATDNRLYVDRISSVQKPGKKKKRKHALLFLSFLLLLLLIFELYFIYNQI